MGKAKGKKGRRQQDSSDDDDFVDPIQAALAAGEATADATRDRTAGHRGGPHVASRHIRSCDVRSRSGPSSSNQKILKTVRGVVTVYGRQRRPDAAPHCDGSAPARASHATLRPSTEPLLPLSSRDSSLVSDRQSRSHKCGCLCVQRLQALTRSCRLASLHPPTP